MDYHFAYRTHLHFRAGNTEQPFETLPSSEVSSRAAPDQTLGLRAILGRSKKKWHQRAGKPTNQKADLIRHPRKDVGNTWECPP